MNLITMQEATDGIAHNLPPEARAEVKFILHTWPHVQIYLKDPKAKTDTKLSVVSPNLDVG